MGQQATTALGADDRREVDLAVLFTDVACEFVEACVAPAQARHLVDRSWRERIEDRVDDGWDGPEARAMNDAEPIDPQRVFWEPSPRLPDRCIPTADSGSATNGCAPDLTVRRGMMASLSGDLATMGPAVPYAIAATFAHPDRPVVAAVGDGTMPMNGLSGLTTIARHWREWTDPHRRRMVEQSAKDVMESDLPGRRGNDES